MSQRKPIPAKERDAVLRQAGYRCAVPTCHTTLAIDIHHIVEVHKDGGNELLNLLALCPTCHALYHRGVITQESIKQWKDRLVSLNRGVDVPAEIKTRIEESSKRQIEMQNKGGQREGFSLAAAEYYWRTCEVGFVYDGRRFVDTGLCCFIAPKLAITIEEVVDWAIEIGAERGGSPVIRTKRGMAPFTILERFDVGKLVVIEMGTIDDSYVKKLLKEYHDDGFMARQFAEPFQTPIRFRFAPYLGERVGILHLEDNSQEYRGRSDFQFDSADVSFEMKCDSPESFLEFALTPILSRVQHRGSPVFTADGLLVGVMKDSILLEGEKAWRPVVSPAFVVKKFSKEIKE